MKKFKFKLQKLLDIRAVYEKNIKNELAKLINLQNIERNKQAELKLKISDSKNILFDDIRNNIYSYNNMMMHERFINSAKKAINIAEQKIHEMEPAVQAVRERLIQASKDKKVLEKLKERKFDEFKYNYNRETLKENDEINQKLYQKKIMENMFTQQ
jgi:flagellar protein FliJ